MILSVTVFVSIIEVMCFKCVGGCITQPGVKNGILIPLISLITDQCLILLLLMFIIYLLNSYKELQLV